MDESKRNINFERLPLIVIDKNGFVIHKNEAFEQVRRVRLKTKADKIFSADICEKIKVSVQGFCIETFEYSSFEGFCSIMSVPMQGERVSIILIPSIYSDVLSLEKSELISIIDKLLSSDKASKSSAISLAKVRKAIYRNFGTLSKEYPQSISVSRLTEITKREFEICAFSVGARLDFRSKPDESAILKANMRAVATELLCMFDAVLYLNTGRSIGFDVAIRFNKVQFTLSCSTGAKELDEGLLTERYVLAKTASAEGHDFAITLEDGTAGLTLTVPLSAKFELSSLDANFAETIFKNAIKL